MAPLHVHLRPEAELSEWGSYESFKSFYRTNRFDDEEFCVLEVVWGDLQNCLFCLELGEAWIGLLSQFDNFFPKCSFYDILRWLK